MKVINKKMCVVLLLVVLEIGSLFLMYKSNGNKEIKLDNVENKIEDNNLFALMVEQTLGTYTTSSSTTWPTGYVLNTLKSGCVDSEGNKIENGMRYDKSNNKVIIDTDKTSNCYVYLSKNSLTRVTSSSQVWDSDLTGDGYRYYGTNPNNYVCFGTQSKSECLSDTDKYMYRIIGMFQEENGNGTINTSSDYHLKLIKKAALKTLYLWHENPNVSDITWNQTDLYKGINGSYFLNNPEYHYMQDNYWYSKISNWKWNSVVSDGVYYNSAIAQNIYLDEMNRSGKPSESASLYSYPTAKIGLMYASDYMLSLGNNAKNYKSREDYTTLATGWIHFLNNDSNSSETTEWTMSQIGPFSMNVLNTWVVRGFGKCASAIMIVEPYIVRPVLYLNSDVVICAGSGTSSDPYILG